MSKGSLNLQDSFLNQVRRESILVRVTLVDGREFRGRVKGFDNFTVVVVGETNEYHLIYKHAIGQIISPKPIHGTTSRKGGSGNDGGDSGSEYSPEAGDGETADFQEQPVAVQNPSDAGGQKRRDGFNTLNLDKIQVKKNAD